MTERDEAQSAGPSPLQVIGSLAGEIGADDIRRDAAALALRLAEQRFYLVCLGQLKRGKSTLLNALIGSQVLPTGVTPVTSVVTVVRYGQRRSVRVEIESSGWREIGPEMLADYASEERNGGNAKRVTGIEVFEPAPLLRTGLCLVDTPGVGSVFVENTEATRKFLPQIDAALIVLGADPPVTADELSLIEAVSSRVPDLLFVLAKSDRMSDSERSEAVAFTKRVLGERLEGHPEISMLEVSAAEVLTLGRPTRDWPALLHVLQELAAKAGADIVASAGERGIASLTKRLSAVLEERIALLERPLAESAALLEGLRASVASAERALSDLSPLLVAEEARLLAALERDRDDFFTVAGPTADRELEAVLEVLTERGPALRRRALAEATVVAKRWLDDWLEKKTTDVDRLFRAANQRFVELLATVEGALADLSDGLDTSSSPIEPRLQTTGHFYMTEMLASAPTSLAATLADFVGQSSSLRRESIQRDARDYLRRLMEVNSARIKNDFRDRLTTARRGLEDEVRRRLRGTIASAETALEGARALRDAGSARVQEELVRLHGALARVQAIAVRGR